MPIRHTLQEEKKQNANDEFWEFDASNKKINFRSLQFAAMSESTIYSLNLNSMLYLSEGR